MKASRRLGWLFALAVIVPSALLAALAVRAVRREEAYLEKRLASALNAEVLALASRVEEELRRVEEELARSLPAATPSGLRLEAWAEGVSLVGVPFLISPGFVLEWPRDNGTLSETQRAFLRWNGEQLGNRVDIPVYQNIALAYQGEIVAEAVEAPAGGAAAKAAAVGEVSAAGPAAEDREAAAPASAADEPARRAEVAQVAVSSFERDAEVRKKVYAQAEEKGQAPAPRNVTPQAASPERQAGAPPSVFVTESLRFGEIIAGKDSGLLPRFQGEELTLLFWKRAAGGRIVGCQLDRAALRTRLVGLLPPAATSERILTLLDEQGLPVFAPQETASRDYRQPFVAREVSGLLPRWEAAAYLADPAALASRARLAGAVLWILVAILVVSIGSGGTLVLRAVRGEVELARQKTSFVAGVSHELKTPLASIRLYAEMLREGRQPDPAKQRQYLGVMAEESRRLTRLVNNVLDFAQLERGRRRFALEPLDLAALCREVLEGERPRLEEAGFAVLLAGAPAAGPLTVRGDAEALKQALLNLLGNAEKYSESSRELRVELVRAGGRALVRVLDRGRGVPPGQVKGLFREFYRADDALTARVKGTGLGLAIARRLVRGQGGDITYSPREGGGSIFQIELPCANAS